MGTGYVTLLSTLLKAQQMTLIMTLVCGYQDIDRMPV